MAKRFSVRMSPDTICMTFDLGAATVAVESEVAEDTLLALAALAQGKPGRYFPAGGSALEVGAAAARFVHEGALVHEVPLEDIREQFQSAREYVEQWVVDNL